MLRLLLSAVLFSAIAASPALQPTEAAPSEAAPWHHHGGAHTEDKANAPARGKGARTRWKEQAETPHSAPPATKTPAPQKHA